MPGKASVHGVDLLPSGFYCPACLVGADRWSALRLAKPSTHGVDLLPSGFYCPACLVGADRWSALRLAQPSTHCVDLLPLLPPGTLLHPAALCRWSSPLMAVPALRAVLAGAATAPWRLARCCPFFRPDRIHAWRGSTLVPTVDRHRCKRPTGAACPRRDLPAGTGRHCWRHSQRWQYCHAPAG